MQPSQGTATIIVAITMVMLFLGGVSIWSLGSVTIGLLSAFAALALFSPYRRARLNVWGDPFGDPDGAGYQTVQSLVGIASGGVDGVGLGAGRAKWGFLPFAHTDFIFSVVAEELGFIGALMLILFYVFLILFGIRVALAAPDRLGMLLAGGITTAIAMQAFINIGAAVNVLPISGVTLPFVSMGGSSLMMNLAAMGIVLNVARQIER
jgi:cell division protein FtsW